MPPGGGADGRPAQVLLDSKVARLGPLDHRVTIFAVEQHQREFSRGRNLLDQRLDDRRAAAGFGRQRIVGADPERARCARRDGRLDDQPFGVEPPPRLLEVLVAALLDGDRRNGRHARIGELGKVGFVAVPAQQRRRVDDRQTRRFGMVEEREPAVVIAVISPRHQRQDQIEARKIIRLRPHDRNHLGARGDQRVGLDVVGPAPRFRIVRIGNQAMRILAD